jgi:hypothetical protein
VGLFRKKATYNEQMLREAGLDRVVFNTPQPVPEPESAEPEEPAYDHSSQISHVMQWARQGAGETVTSVVAPGIAADSVSFAVLPAGDLIVFGDTDDDLSVLADAIEASLLPPYRAEASRHEGDIWGVRAWRIEVAEFAYPDAETLQLAQRDGVSDFRIDGGPTDVAPPAQLRQLGESAGAEYFATAQRIDGDYWEVMVNRF